MATVEKDFKIKKGLIVEGTTGTINNHDILTKKTDDQNYIIGLIGGSADSANTPNTVVKRDGSGDFVAGTITADLVGDVTGNADTATALETARTIELTGDVTGQVNFNGTANVQISTTINGSFATDAEVATAKSEAISSSNGYTDSAITTEVTNRNSAIATAKSEAISDAGDYTDTRETAITAAYQSYADTAETDAVTTANAYTDTREGLITTAYETYADNAVDAHNDLTSGVHDVTGDVVGTTDTQTLSNKTLGSDLAAGGFKVSGLATPTANADAATKSYVDTAVANLVDSAPELLDTLNELAAAIGDDANFVSTVTTSLGEKVAKAGDSMTGNLDFGGTNKVTSLAAPTSNGDAANKLYVDTAESDAVSSANSYTDGRETAITAAYETYANQAETDAVTTANAYTDTRETAITAAYQSYADTAETDAVTTANAYADGLAVNYDAVGSAAQALSDAEDYTDNAINALTTSDIEEGSNLYYTAARAKAEAATLLANATQTNITITKDGSDNLTIIAENGVADSDTDDLTEGTTHLYFTDARAVSALEAVTPQFQAVDITWATKNTATYTYVANASVATAMSWSTNYASAKFLVRVRSGNHSQVSEVLVTADNSNNVAITEYAIVGTNGNLGNVSANFSGGQYNLTVETTENNSEVIVYATLMAYGD